MMIDYGEQFWRGRWPTLYDGLAGNPLAAMPSLHFATSVMSAHVLSDVGRAEGTVAWVYAGTLGFALVYLGEHYVIDLLAGLALVEGLRTAAPRLAPLADGFSRLVQGLEHRAQGA
jgi:membrane-associated phospholipid phosphatase